MMENQCSNIKHDVGYSNRCTNPGKVKRDGKWWCGTHDPERLAAKARARTSYVQAEQKALNAIFAVRDEITVLVEKHPDFQKLNAQVKAAEEEYHRLRKERTKVGLNGGIMKFGREEEEMRRRGIL